MKSFFIVDAFGRTVALSRFLWCLVFFVFSQMELLVDLGLDVEVVGVIKFCVHFVYWRWEKVVVGGTKIVDCVAIVVLKPDFVLVNKEENMWEIVEVFVVVVLVYVTDVYDLFGVLAMIVVVGVLVDRVFRAVVLVAEIEVAFGVFF